jgi:hypothetical protein
METWADAEGTKQSNAIANAVNPMILSLIMIPPECLSARTGAGLRRKRIAY